MRSAPSSPAEAEAIDAADAPVDGRRHRTVMTRRRIVEALTALIREGAITPTAEQVSARAGVGLRTVFRHFEDMETLYREINSEVEAVLLPALQVRLKAGSWQERLQESLLLRAKLFERVMPFYIGTLAHRHESNYLATQIELGVQLDRELLRKLLPAALRKDRARFEALLLVLSIEAWVRLRREQGLSAALAIKAMQLAVGALIHEQS